MKKSFLIVCLAAALGLATGAMAQSAGPVGGAPSSSSGNHAGHGQREKITEEILAKLHLTADQKAKLKAHAEELKNKIKEIRKGSKGAPTDEQKAKMKELRKANHEFLKQTLTKDQLREFMKLRNEKMKELKEKNKGSGKVGTP
ncbi:hypothetical protein [Fimbriimonas ginsengisoli]|uniref:P pilus assembly/Cpx signaling pathway, periplasmic inhibitor/zinc-resistance associated protein n=1 Tax=Fimbriimonas ginsengisoli Gsoil 348 TaxID=661478 RepID=A0A068NWA8_FIMGI|nr:hypothetical protein [Fimbriimonas ginsengisoli]AIE85889.1 hypothetical protein OP10G_2521 [Fimbriimonas ginsengisoli Gsoil 348]